MPIRTPLGTTFAPLLSLIISYVLQKKHVIKRTIIQLYNGMLVPVRTSINLHQCNRLYQLKVNVGTCMLNITESYLADVSGVSPSSDEGLMLQTSTSTSSLCP